MMTCAEKGEPALRKKDDIQTVRRRKKKRFMDVVKEDKKLDGA